MRLRKLIRLLRAQAKGEGTQAGGPDRVDGLGRDDGAHRRHDRRWIVGLVDDHRADGGGPGVPARAAVEVHRELTHPVVERELPLTVAHGTRMQPQLSQ